MSEADPRAARNCYKCGRQIGPDETICAICNRAGMATPSATQYHGTIVVAIIAGVVILAIAASLAIRGVGPFDGSAVAFRADPPDGIVVTVRVINLGSKQGRAKCELTARDGGERIQRILATVSPPIPAGGTIDFDARMPGLTTEPASVVASCL
jgi:RNA polymerase subunit RPABC4/transcription elongation factor Spt4